MRPDEIRSHLKRQPFQPLRVFISDGASYVIRHPEMAYVTRTDLIISLELGEYDIPERNVHCDPLHVTRIEPFNGAPSTPPTDGNGQQNEPPSPSSGAAAG